MMGLYRRGQTWFYAMYVDGQRIRKSTGVTNRRMAEDIFGRARLERREGRFFRKDQSSRKTFEQLVKEYMDGFTSNKAASSIKRDRQLAAHLLSAFGHLLLKDVTPVRITSYQQERQRQGASSKTINLETSLGKHIFNIGSTQLEWTQTNPFKKVPSLKLPPLRTRWLDDVEIERLYEASDSWLIPIIMLALNTGLRESDVLGMRWQSINFGKNIITVRITKTNKMLYMPMNNIVKGLLSRLNKVRRINCDFVFHNDKGERLSASTLRHGFDRACKRAGIQDATFHTLRHTFASRLVSSGVSLFTVQELLAHSTPTLTQRYSHLSPDNLQAAVNVLNGTSTATKTATAVDGGSPGDG